MESVEVLYTGPGKNENNLSPQDERLVVTNLINSSFGRANDYMELFVYGENGELLLEDYDAADYYPNILNNPQNNTYSNLLLDPEKDLKNRGFNRGNLTTQYNFYKRLFNSSVGTTYWIKQISPSRTELKIASQVLSDAVINEGYQQYLIAASSANYYPVFFLNFGRNEVVMANNVLFGQDDQGGYLLIKLYEPLPSQYDLKSQFWIVDKIAESVSYQVNISVEAEQVVRFNSLRGPNYNVRLNTKNGQTTPYYTYDSLLVSPISSSAQKLASYYQDKAIQINVDYSNFSNFIHFSSATERVNNFVYKLQLIESASLNILSQNALVPGNESIVNSAITAEQQAIDNIIKNFDIYEYFLYFNSSSWAWPKSTSVQPYALYSVTSSIARNFIGSETTVPTAATASLLFSASYYDATNKDLLHNSIPQYLLDDPANQPFVTFLDMIGQHFDNVWVYYKDLSNRFNATNNPNTGISLDIVSDALKGLGMQLYTNTNVSDNLYYTLFGINPDGSLLPPTGSEKITNYVTSSIATLPAETIQDELYKRVYHNLPYLLKSKGTLRGVKALISTYGIPEDILTVREFGGNYTGSLDGIIDLDASNYKVQIVTGSGGNVTGSLTISSSLLSPYTTIQYYQGNSRLNNTNLEVGFSPSDKINDNITGSLGVFNINQLIGSPGYLYSSSYSPLVSASNAYFSSYTQKNSVWEYIRLLKFYNNTLFKTIKDFVPARANISTGIIIKSHMLERNKYARHEPTVTFNDYSQSINMGSVTGSEGGALTDSTEWSAILSTPLGTVPYTSSTGVEKFNGELGGSNVVVTNGLAFSQYPSTDQNYFLGTINGSYIISQNGNYLVTSYDTYEESFVISAIDQNVMTSERSKFLLDLDYNSDQLIPVNYNAVTYSINQTQINNYAAYTNPNNPFAQVQDYNYYLNRSVIPRYSGSYVQSATYNTYTDGDISYGKTAAIDKIKYQYAYLIDIYSASLFLPGRSNAQIKYIIDNNQNVLDLTKANKNIFEVQNIFKSGETTNISLFDYDETNPYTQQLANDPTLAIYEGGWRYLPMLHNVSRSSANQYFELPNPITVNITVSSGGGSTPDPSDPELQISNYDLRWYSTETVTEPLTTSDFSIRLEAQYTGGTSVSYGVTLSISYRAPEGGACSSTTDTTSITIAISTNSAFSGELQFLQSFSYEGGNGSSYAGGSHWPSSVPTDCYAAVTSVSTGGGRPRPGTTNTFTYYTNIVSSSQSCVYLVSQSNEIVLDPILTYYYYNNSPLIFSSSGDIDWAGSGLPPVILPLNPAVGDKMSFFDSASRLGWNELNEYTVKNVRITGSNPPTSVSSSALLLQMAEPINLALFSSGSTIPTESITRSPRRACRYILWKHVPDETNVMLRFNPKDATIVENGLLFPQYIDTPVRENSGNVIKALKQQNLI